MPLLMTDVAAGSSAVRTLQQNVMGSENDQLAEDARKADLQAKIQNDALETQQKQLDVNKTRLANIVTQSNIDLTDRVQNAIKEVQQDPKYKDASESTQSRMVAKALEEAGDPIGASKIREQAAVTELKEAQTKVQAANETHDTLAKADATIADATPEQVKKIIDGWDDKTKAAVKSMIPDYQEEDPELLKKQLSRMMLNASGQNMAMQWAARERIADKQDAARERIAETRGVYALMAKALGKDGSEKKDDERKTQKIMSDVEIDERQTTKEINKLHQATLDAQTEAKKHTGWMAEHSLFGKSPAAVAKDKVDAAWQAESDARKELAQRALERYRDLPPGEHKDALIKKQLDLLDTFETNEPPPIKSEAKKEDKKAQPAAATSNKAPEAKPAEKGKSLATFKDQAAFNMAWNKLKSGEAITGPDGKLYTKR